MSEAGKLNNLRASPFKNSLAGKTIKDVLLHFGDTVKVSRRRYRQFVNNGIDQGKRPELQGGGLVRPACHARAKGLLNLIDVEKGNGTVKKQMEVEARAGRSAGGDKTGLLGRKKEEREKEDDLRSPVKRKSIVEAKSAFGYIAIKQMGYSGREVGRFLNMRSYSAIRRPARFAFDSENNFK